MKNGSRQLPPLTPSSPCPVAPLERGGALAELAGCRLQLLHAWWWRMGSDWAMARRMLPHGMLFIPIDRIVRVEVGEQRFVVKPGQLVVLPAGVPQSAQYAHQRPPHFDVLALHLVLTDCHGRDVLQRFPHRIAVPGWPDCLPRLRKLAEHFHAGGADGQAAATIAVHSLLADLLISIGGLAPLPVPDHRVSRCLERITADATGRLTVETLASEVGISSRRLRDLFRASTGLPPKDHLIRVRMHEATRLLADPTLPLSDVTTRLGFTSEQEFRACFRRVLGMTPTAWQKRSAV